MGEKSPAFSFYPKDFMSGTATMTLEERGAYLTLLCYQWDNVSIPSGNKAIARILGVSEGRARHLWASVCTKFAETDGVHRNERLEQERIKQLNRRTALAENGAKGGRPPKAKPKLDETNSFPVAKANDNQNESLSSSSSGSDHHDITAREGAQGPGAFEPGSLHRDHLKHAVCGPNLRVCLDFGKGYTAMATRYGGENLDEARDGLRRFLGRVEDALGPSKSPGNFIWLLRQYDAWLIAEGRTPDSVVASKADDPATIAKAAYARQVAARVK